MKPVTWSIKELVEMTEDRIKNRFDANIIVSGSTGLGKSSFLYKFFHKFPDFKMKDKLTYSRTETIDLIKNYKYSYVWNDEMISAGNKRKFYDTEQIELIESLTKYRSNYNIFGGAIPVFFSLDKELLKLFGIHIQVISRGLAIVHLPKEGRMFSDDIWDIRVNQHLEEKWSKKRQKNPNFKIPYHKYTTFAGYVSFGKLGKRQEEEYEELKAIKRGDYARQEEQKPEESFYDKLLRIIKGEKMDERSLFNLCLFNDKKLSSVKTRLNQMLKDGGEERTLRSFLKKQKKDSDTNNLHNNTITKELSEIDL